MDKKDIKYISEHIFDFYNHAISIAEQYLELKGIRSRYGVENLSFEDGYIVIRYDGALCGCCHEDSSEYMPIEYLYEDSWIDGLEAQLQKEKEEKERLAKLEKKRKERAEKKAKEEKDKKEYMRLKKKYEEKD